MKANEFRKELIKIMPGYTWTIHRPNCYAKNYLSATGIQSSGFNRLSTLQVVTSVKDGEVKYDVKSAGNGRNAPWLSDYTDKTLARALRGLQNYYEAVASKYGNHASALQSARKRGNDTL